MSSMFIFHNIKITYNVSLDNDVDHLKKARILYIQ